MSLNIDRVFEKLQYENDVHWGKVGIDKWTQQKIDVIKSIIPEDVASIADIGCGNGMITRNMGEKYFLVGIDRSLTALKYVHFSKINADVTHLPLKDNCIDLALSSEVLEHLPGKTLDDAIQELKRISKKYILITVPNQEYLSKNAVKCSECDFEFNASFHFNSFCRQKLEGYFPEYKILKFFECGMPVRQYNPFLLKIRQRIGNAWGRFTDTLNIICPRCGHHFIAAPNKNMISILCDGLNRFFSPRKPYWMGILFEKKPRFNKPSDTAPYKG